jgi:hypothetical protein
MSQDVTDFIDNLKLEWQADISAKLRETVKQAVPDVDETIQYRKPHYRKNGKYLAVIGTAKGWVSFTIFNATALETPDTLFESSENGDRKTIKIREGQAVDYDDLVKLVKQAADGL